MVAMNYEVWASRINQAVLKKRQGGTGKLKSDGTISVKEIFLISIESDFMKAAAPGRNS